MFKQTKVTLPKIGCQGCMKKVVSALTPLPTLTIIATDLPSKSVVLHYDEQQLPGEEIEQALQHINHVISHEEEISCSSIS
ncbi:heavy-metal-associated domain-containing protein [Dictyobacter arantiisoli]|uniref:HMA domain-containing protein n=1 Tax=Dictyobacter arantiisoli TaxID=2014874 RepID=A0A5A5T6X0_9CHLR|nr:heavy-metal-associated domain-containing protein [Dictyobacter arantiisoli]GCF06995.1 hypothetical protein KDI_05590 [Dictyobacter arantiisoli]